MEAHCTNKKIYQLSDDGQPLGELTYKNQLYLKAQFKLLDGECYEAKPVGFFGTSISITKNGEEIASIKMNWRGQMQISFTNGQEFMLKAKGLLQDKYIIENEAGEKIAQLDPKFKWAQFNYNYAITYNQHPQNILLILLCVYASNYFIASMSGAVGGIG